MSNPSLKEQLLAMAAELSCQPSLDPEPTKKPTTNPVAKTSARTLRHPKKKPKPKWLDYLHHGVSLLKTHFPACFKSAALTRPLKKGIKQDLMKFLSASDNILIEDKACMVKSLAYYVNTMAYHKSVVAGTARIDLSGLPAGIVSAEEAAYSVERQKVKLNAKQAATPSAQAKLKEEVVP